MASDDLGAHVSTAGGIARAPARAAELESVVLQLFTKQPSRWAEPVVTPEIATEFRRERAAYGIRAVAAHDAYLINLATADSVLFDRSCGAFCSELERCELLGIEFLVTHPGNATDGEMERGLVQNAAAIERALRQVPGGTQVLLETTAGGGKVIGSRFEGTLGLEPFRRILNDERFRDVAKLLETPKGDDPKQYAAVDRANLTRLRELRA